ncbi:2-iminobutanoate/2-iminopropanoate deaminase isoform X3 [Ornithorhynchus anatinus]|uniref:2-iminobutanoate/2-iminopropanoate deaminase isoform X3 n=1 Tax=Ornithorhynchus anatinus TaxID=9258 RepID=UPI0019D4D0AA|nr:2-iminobutanoate/2-iminopropanoate deaminase isoform X3 [Ornithorhynchus anatinus]
MSSLIKKVISTAKAPGAIGPYSQAVLVDKTMYISGQIGMDPANGQLVPGGVVEEAKQALSNMGEILKAADCDFSNVVKTTVLLADINDFNAVNEIYKQCFERTVSGKFVETIA